MAEVSAWVLSLKATTQTFVRRRQMTICLSWPCFPMQRGNRWKYHWPELVPTSADEAVRWCLQSHPEVPGGLQFRMGAWKEARATTEPPETWKTVLWATGICGLTQISTLSELASHSQVSISWGRKDFNFEYRSVCIICNTRVKRSLSHGVDVRNE